MKTDWRQFCRVSNFTLEGDTIRVLFAEGRQHVVRVQDEGDAIRLRAVVVRAAAVASLPDATLRTWLRNRAISLVGFRIDERGRMLGEAWVPRAGLTAEEFRVYVHTVAAESDRFEQQLTGLDKE
jgi:hypothetical protein